MSHPAAIPYYKSLVSLYASWDADFIKVDCIFAANFHQEDIIAISQSISESGADILLSLSPGMKGGWGKERKSRKGKKKRRKRRTNF